MSTIRIDDVLNIIEQKHIMVFATSSLNIVTARTMSVIAKDRKIYFQTDESMLKIDQIKRNPNVAFCVDNIQMQGLARIIGNWDKNPTILREYLKVHKSSYEKFKNLKAEIVVETELKRIEMWEYRENKPYLIRIDLDKSEIVEEEYKLP